MVTVLTTTVHGHCLTTPRLTTPFWTTPIGRPLFIDTVHGHCLTTTVHDHCLTTPCLTTPFGRPLFIDHCSWSLFDDHCSWSLFDDPSFDDPFWTTPIGRPLFTDHCSWSLFDDPSFDDPFWTTPIGRTLAHLNVQSKKTITWSIGVRIEKFESLTSSSLMGLQFIRRIHFQIPFISDPKIRFKVRLVDPNWQN